MNASTQVDELAKHQSISTAVFTSLIINCGVPGNLVVIILICCERKLRNSTGMFLLSLAIADLGVGCLSSPFALVSAINGGWFFSDELCQFNGFLNALFCEVSLLTLAAVSADRYFAIIHPLRYPSIVTRPRAKAVISSIWFLAALFGISPFMGWGKYDVTPPQFGCAVKWKYNISFSATTFIMFAILPFTVIVYVYFSIFKVTRVHIQNINQQTCETSQQAKQRKALTTIIIIVGLWLLCWTPYFVVSAYLALTAHDSNSAVLTYSALIAFGNSAINPYIYTAMNAEVRKTLVKKLRSMFQAIIRV